MPDTAASDTGIALPSVQLAFGGSSSALWDDQELVHAYDAAMSEFHMHHPGPGSWLDKATAALALGKPLPGAQSYGTRWYAAAGPPESSAQSLADDRPKKRPRASQTPAQVANPYKCIAPTRISGQERSPGSPTFSPLSPPGNATPTTAQNYEEQHDGPSGEVEQASGQPLMAGNAEEPDPGPHVAAGSADEISEETALSYAMQAQYMAGYWMGMAQAKRQSTGSHQTSNR